MKKLTTLFSVYSLQKLVVLLCVFASGTIGFAQNAYDAVLFENVSVFDGKNQIILTQHHVLINGNRIAIVSATPLSVEPNTHIPGLIDIHVHMIFGSLTMRDMMAPDVSPSCVNSL